MSKKLTYWFVSVCLASAIILLVTLVVGYRKYGSWSRFNDGLRGVEHLVQADALNVGQIKVNEEKEVVIPFHNDSATPVKVLGYQSTCQCQPLGKLPFVVGPNETVHFKVKMGSQNVGKSFGRVQFHTDQAELPDETVRLNAEIIKTP